MKLVWTAKTDTTKKRKNRADESDSNENDGKEENIFLTPRPPARKLRARMAKQPKKDDNAEDAAKGSALSASDTTSESEDDQKRRSSRKSSRKGKRAPDPEEVERRILEITGVAPDYIGEDWLMGMTASDITMRSLEYLENINVIRVKSGKLQGGLSGELKKRTAGLGEMIRVLQIKAEAKSDPEFLKFKISELMNEIRDYRRGEEKRISEVRELKEIIKELKRENRETREELRKVQEEVRRSSEERMDNRGARGKEELERLGRKEMKKVSDIVRSREESRSRSPSVVYRPAIQGKSIPIPESPAQSVEARANIVDMQISALLKCKNKLLGKNTSQEDMDIESSKEDETNEAMPMKDDIKQFPPLPQRKFRIIVKQNVQVAPPYSERKKLMEGTEVNEEGKETNKEEEGWNKSRKERKREKRKKKEKASNQPVSSPPFPSSGESNKGKGKEKEKERVPRRRVPRTAAISIKGKVENFSYAEAMKRARTKVSLQELQIESPKIRKGVNGATIIEISGPENTAKADKLAAKLREILEDAVVTRPSIKGELRVSNLEESITKEELEFAVAEEGECKIQEVKVGAIRLARSGLNTAWLRCPLKSAMQIAKKGKIRVGWTIAKVELQKARPALCYKCWRTGHTIRNCKATVDYSTSCFKCGKIGHAVKTCMNPIRCVLCHKLNKNDEHRVGSAACEGVRISESQDPQVKTSMRRNEEKVMDTDEDTTVQC